jgi:hypothetical protein
MPTDPDALQAWYVKTFGAESATPRNLPAAKIPGGEVDFLEAKDAPAPTKHPRSITSVSKSKIWKRSPKKALCHHGFWRTGPPSRMPMCSVAQAIDIHFERCVGQAERLKRSLSIKSPKCCWVTASTTG